MTDNNNSAEKILDDIFIIMQKLYNEIRLNENGYGNHLMVFNLFANLGKTLVGADRASFWRWDKSNGKLITAAATGINEIVIDEGSGLVGRALKENRPVVENDPYNQPDFNSEVDKQTEYTTKSVLVLPVSNCRGEVIGAFQVINKLSGLGFDEKEDVKRLSIAAFICGMALESDIFLAEAQHDKLTGLKNRFGFYADFNVKYEKMMHTSKRTPLSLVICDIDFFKKVNDTYGHNGGDVVLRHVADILSKKISTNDGLYRWGGEEFIIIFVGDNIVFSEYKTEDIRKSVAESTCFFEGQEIKITMSFGCTEISPALTIDENLQIADNRLYRAKETGRNKVITTD